MGTNTSRPSNYATPGRSNGAAAVGGVHYAPRRQQGSGSGAGSGRGSSESSGRSSSRQARPPRPAQQRQWGGIGPPMIKPSEAQQRNAFWGGTMPPAVRNGNLVVTRIERRDVRRDERRSGAPSQTTRANDSAPVHRVETADEALPSYRGSEEERGPPPAYVGEPAA